MVIGQKPRCNPVCSGAFSQFTRVVRTQTTLSGVRLLSSLKRDRRQVAERRQVAFGVVASPSSS
jgi:hypothetical protein